MLLCDVSLGMLGCCVKGGGKPRAQPPGFDVEEQI
jgi:hypothetical protein